MDAQVMSEAQLGLAVGHLRILSACTARCACWTCAPYRLEMGNGLPTPPGK